MKQPFTPARVVLVLLLVLIVITISRAYRAFWSPPALPPDATPSSCLDFYRRELSAQYQAVTWRRLLAEIVLFSVVLRISFMTDLRFEAARVLLPVFLVLILFGRYCQSRKLKRELGALSTFEKEDNDAHNTGR